MFPVSDVIPSRTKPFVTIGLIALTALVFLYQLLLDREEMSRLAHTFGVVPAALSAPALLTSLLLHDGWIHFGGNMLYLWIFGDNVEDALGHAGYLLFYLLSGVVAALVHTALNLTSSAPLIGASGAIAATMGAYFVLYPRSQILTAIFLVLYLDIIEVPAIVFLAVWLVMQLLSGLASMGAGAADGGVAFGAHVAGFLSGVSVGVVLRRKRRKVVWEGS